MRLTTVSKVRQYTGITGDTQAMNTLRELIAQVSERIATRCNRDFEIQTYKVWLDGTGDDLLMLPQYPVVALYQASVLADDVATVKCNIDGATNATVGIASGTMNLYWFTSAGADSSASITLSDYPTLALLEAQIETYGWDVVIQSGYGTYPSVLLKPIASAWALSPDFANLSLPDDGTEVELVPQTNAMLRRCLGSFPCGSANIFVNYRAGYTLPQDQYDGVQTPVTGNVPDGLQLVVAQIVNDLWRTRTEPVGHASESIGNYSYSSKSIDSVIDARWGDLAIYSRKYV